MTCHNCKNENKELGGNHVYKCLKCKIELGRDINASINIYNNGIVKC
jgi:transposase